MKHPHIVIKDGKWYPAGAEVPEDAPVEVELTGDVPEGALDENADGSMNAYDQNGNVVGTVPAEEVEKLQEQAGEAFDEPEKAKRGRKKE